MDFSTASDRTGYLDGQLPSAPEDVVFPALYPGTLQFLKLLPDGHGGDALDLCGGSGIGALVLSRTSRHAVTTDITERSTFFAEFNARLNNAPIVSLCGNLYEPVKDKQFDLITAHPPFVPAAGRTMIFRDAGETGEDIIRGTVEGLPSYLRVGGTCMIRCAARDTDVPFEQRAREWLGATGEEFDIIFGLEKTSTPEEVVNSVRERLLQAGPDEPQLLLDRLQALGTKQYVHGALFIRRAARAGARSRRCGCACWRRRRLRISIACSIGGGIPAARDSGIGSPRRSRVRRRRCSCRSATRLRTTKSFPPITCSSSNQRFRAGCISM